MHRLIINQLLETAQNNKGGYFEFKKIGKSEEIVLEMELGRLVIIEENKKYNFQLFMEKYNRIDYIDGVPELETLNLLRNLKKDMDFSDILEKMYYTYEQEKEG